MWVDAESKIKSDKNGWSDVSFAFMEGDRPILLTADAIGTNVGFNTPTTKETVNAELNTKVNQYRSASTTTPSTSTTTTVKPTAKSALSGLVKASQTKEATAASTTSTTTQPSNTSNALDDLEKLADLKAKGILTEEEFQAKKKQILGL